MKFNRHLIQFSLLLSVSAFALAMALKVYFIQDSYDPVSFKSRVAERLKVEIDYLEKEAKPYIAALENGDSLTFSKYAKTLKYPLYAFDEGKLKFWTDFRHIPNHRVLRGVYDYKYISVPKGKFLVRKWTFGDAENPTELFGLIPLYISTKIENKYLRPQYNKAIFASDAVQIKEPQPNQDINVGLRNSDCFFSITFAPNYVEGNPAFRKAVMLLLVLSIVLFLLFILGIINYITRKYGVEWGFLSLTILLVVLRLGMLGTAFPNSIFFLPLFDPGNFASSSLNPSLGDLLINETCLMAWVWFVFVNFHKSNLFVRAMRTPRNGRFAIAATMGAIGFFVMLYQFIVIQTIYHNSHYTLDITNTIQFSLPRIMCFFIVVANAVVFFLCFHIVYRFSATLLSNDNRRLMAAFATGAAVFSLINTLTGQDFVIVLLIGMFYCVAVNLLNLPRQLNRVRYISLIYFFSSAVVSALLGTYAIYNFEQERETDNKVRFAEVFLEGKDEFTEYLLSEIMDKIRGDLFIRNRFGDPFSDKKVIKEKVRRAYLGNYFDKYTTKVLLFGPKGNPIGERNFLEGEGAFQESIELEQYKTEYPGLYFINDWGEDYSKRYLSFISMERYGLKMGYICMVMSLKKNIPNSVYPELLIDRRFLSPYEGKNYSYALFFGDKIANSAGEFNYKMDFDKSMLQSQALFKKGVVSHGFAHHAVSRQEGRVTVVSGERYPIVNLISNFSFLLLVDVFTMLFFLAVYAVYHAFFESSLNYSTKIQLYLNLAFFLPLMAVSITTLSLINSTFKEEVNYEYYKKAVSIAKSLQKGIDASELKPSAEQLATVFNEVSKYNDADANLFDAQGRLIATSKEEIYDYNLLSRLVNPQAMAHLKENGKKKLNVRESVGGLSYNSTYLPVKPFNDDKLLGILSVPFFESEYELEREQIEIFTNIMNIFTVIFIIFLGISYFASKWLTFPLKFITQKLKKTTLSGFNEPLNWDSDDEIGLMVMEYNRMVMNLEESKRALARSEKESAWREMAQQVAHEIKNPLTPMKLTLQHLSRKVKNSNEEGISLRPINTLLHQVETLNDIATSFSTFAKMPMPENERFELVATLKDALGLFKNIENGTLEADIPETAVFVMGDQKLMGRIVSNLVINSKQSKAEQEQVHIQVSLKVSQRKKVLITVADNGDGIPEDIQEKVFVPNFTTKAKGSGIGLAIAKHGIEHSNGKIWFETTPGQGTAFYIELPVVS